MTRAPIPPLVGFLIAAAVSVALWRTLITLFADFITRR